MRVLPVANYQTQNQRNKKQNVNFGSFVAKEEVFSNLQMLLCYCDLKDTIKFEKIKKIYMF